MKLFNAFKDILEAAITNDGTQLGASIVNIIESSVDMVNRFWEISSSSTISHNNKIYLKEF